MYWRGKLVDYCIGCSSTIGAQSTIVLEGKARNYCIGAQSTIVLGEVLLEGGVLGRGFLYCIEWLGWGSGGLDCASCM